MFESYWNEWRIRVLALQWQRKLKSQNSNDSITSRFKGSKKARNSIWHGLANTHTHTHLHSHAHSARGGSRVEYKPQTGGMNNTGWESDRHSVTPTWYPLMCGICNHMPEWEAVRHSDAFNSSSCGRTSRRRRSRTWLPWCHDASGRMPAIQLDESQGGPLASGLSISLNAKHHIHIYNSKYTQYCLSEPNSFRTEITGI